MRRVFFIALMTFGTSTALAEDAVERVVLSLQGATVDVSAGDIITFEGTLTSTHDGAEFDAFSRRAHGLEFVDAGPFVNVPTGSELVEADREAHRYVVRVGQDGQVAFAIERIAMQQLVTRSDAAASLRGALELARPVIVDAPAPALAAAALDDESTPAWPFGVLLAFGSGLFAVGRRRSDGFGPLLRRARRAHAQVVLEAKRLGPAFEPVTDSTQRLVETLSSLRAHCKEADAARARIRGRGSEAVSRRLGLAGEAADSLKQAVEIVDRLEGVAAHMASAVADHARATGVEDALLLVKTDLGLALDADDAARALC